MLGEHEVSIVADIPDLHIELNGDMGKFEMRLRNSEGEESVTQVTPQQAGAIMALAIQDEYEGITEQLYAIAGEAVDKLPQTLRPIP